MHDGSVAQRAKNIILPFCAWLVVVRAIKQGTSGNISAGKCVFSVLYGGGITRGKCVLRYLGILPTLRDGKCVFSVLYGGDITRGKIVYYLEESLYTRDVMLTNVSSLIAPS